MANSRPYLNLRNLYFFVKIALGFLQDCCAQRRPATWKPLRESDLSFASLLALWAWFKSGHARVRGVQKLASAMQPIKSLKKRELRREWSPAALGKVPPAECRCCWCG